MCSEISIFPIIAREIDIRNRYILPLYIQGPKHFQNKKKSEVSSKSVYVQVECNKIGDLVQNKSACFY